MGMGQPQASIPIFPVAKCRPLFYTRFISHLT